MINTSNGVNFAIVWNVIQVVLYRKSSVVVWLGSAIFKGNSVLVQKFLKGL